MQLSTDRSVRGASSLPKPHRLLCLQNSSIFEAFGGIEFYQDDVLTQAGEIYSKNSVWSVIAQRKADTVFDSRPYHISPVLFQSSGWSKRIENRFSFSLLRKAKQICNDLNPSLIVAGHIGLSPLAYILSRWTGVPYVAVAYGIECWGSTYPHDELAFRNAKGILSISYWTKKILVDRGYDASRIKIIHPQLPVGYEKHPAPRAPKPTGEYFTLLTVSRLDAQEQYKGQDHVLQAMDQLRRTHPELKLRYIIQGEGTDRPRLEALAKELGLTDRVEFRGTVKSRDEIERTYREADLYVMPSRFGCWDKRWRGEGFGIVYLEAAALGVPSVAYDCGGATDIIRHGVNGMLVKPDNISELALTIRHLASNRELLFQLGKKAHEICMRDFTRPAVRKQIVEALNAF